MHFVLRSFLLSSSLWHYPLWRIISDVQWGLLYKYSLLRFSLGMLHFEPVLEKWSQNNRVRIKFCVYSHESAFPSPLFLTLWIWPRNAQYYVMKSREGTWTYFSSKHIILLITFYSIYFKIYIDEIKTSINCI